MASVTDPLGWTSVIWDTLKKAVHDETQRTKIAQKILPLNPISNAISVASDIVIGTPDSLTVTEESIPLIETIVQFSMTKTQVQQEQQMSTASTLAKRAANLASFTQDLLIFQGPDNATNLPRGVKVRLNGNKGKGLLGKGDKDIEVIEVSPVSQDAGKPNYGLNTFAKVAEGIASLQRDMQYGPYALILHTDIFANTYTPVDKLVIPAESMIPLVPGGFYGSSALPEGNGCLLSTGGEAMDLTVGVDATPEYVCCDAAGMYNFRVVERFVPRLKDKRGTKRLEFNKKK